MVKKFHLCCFIRVLYKQKDSSQISKMKRWEHDECNSTFEISKENMQGKARRFLLNLINNVRLCYNNAMPEKVTPTQTSKGWIFSETKGKITEVSYCSWETGLRLVIAHNSSYRWKKIQDATSSSFSSWREHLIAPSRWIQETLKELLFGAMRCSLHDKIYDAVASWIFFIDEMSCERWRVWTQSLSYNSLFQLLCRIF